jgi:thiol-disulfide isomerase/thioredoxin
MTFLAIGAGAALALLLAGAERPPSDCYTSADQAALHGLRSDAQECGADADCLKRVDQAWKAVLRKHAHDAAAHRLYQTFGPTTAAEKTAYYKEILEARPAEAFALTSYGRSLPKDKPADSIEYYKKALAVDPGYMPAHLALASIFAGRSGEEHRDAERAASHLRAALAVCPKESDALELVWTLGDVKLAGEIAAARRRTVESSATADMLKEFPQLWKLEFRAVPPSEHAALRERIAADLKHLEGLKLQDQARWWEVLEEGYESAGNDTKRRAVQQEMRKRFPCEPASLSVEAAEWDKEHPAPANRNDEAAQKAYWKSQYDFAVEQTVRCPDYVASWQRRVLALKHLDLPDADAAASVDGLLKVLSRVIAPLSRQVHQSAMETILNRGLKPAPLADLLDRWQAFPAPVVRPPTRAAGDKQAEEKDRLFRESHLRRERFARLLLQGRVENRLDRKSDRDATIARMKELIAALPTDSPSVRGELRQAEAQLAWLRAETAEAEGRTADAMVFYRKAYEGLSYDAELVRVTRAALKRLGASDEALADLVVPKRTYVTGPSGSMRWTTVERKVPAVSLDTSAGKWSPDSLKGKRTLINFWATWCGPCKDELPELQKLHEKMKGRNDIAVLTFNVDENPALVEPFVKEHKYTFPVVYANAFWDGLDVDKGIPTNWIVDADGVVRAENRGFGVMGAARWAEQVLAKLEGKAEEKKSPATDTVIVHDRP